MAGLTIPMEVEGTAEVVIDPGRVRMLLVARGIETTLGMSPSEAVKLGKALIQAAADAAFDVPRPGRLKKGGGK